MTSLIMDTVRRKWCGQQRRRQMDQQMVSCRRIPEDDRAAWHMQRKGGCAKETGRGIEKDRRKKGRTPSEELFIHLSLSSFHAVSTKGQQTCTTFSWRVLSSPYIALLLLRQFLRWPPTGHDSTSDQAVKAPALLLHPHNQTRPNQQAVGSPHGGASGDRLPRNVNVGPQEEET
ncbi:uncharacterized protein ACBT44_013349 [Syngnathus typhle]